MDTQLLIKEVQAFHHTKNLAWFNGLIELATQGYFVANKGWCFSQETIFAMLEDLGYFCLDGETWEFKPLYSNNIFWIDGHKF